MLRREPGQIHETALLPTLNHRLVAFLHESAKVYDQWKLLFFFFNIKHNYINEIHSKNFELSDQKFMLLLLPSEDTAFLHCYCINLCSVLLHLMLVKSKLDKAVITCFYLLFLDSFSSGSVIIWQVNMKLLKFIFQIQVPNVWWHAQWTSGNAHSPLPFQWGLG